MDEFEALLTVHKAAVERLVRYKLPTRFDAEDVLQETYLQAMLKFHTLRNKSSFKPWILAIARNQCNAWFRRKSLHDPLSLEELLETRQLPGSQGIEEVSATHETLNALKLRDKQILQLFYLQDLSMADIAHAMQIPIGTVKSRLHAAKIQFRKHYPYPPQQKGVAPMKKMPAYLPEYQITPSAEPEFPVRHEELPGMLIIPRLGETLTFGMYDFPERKRTGVYHQTVTGKVVVHGLEGVEIQSKYTDADSTEESTIFAQLTDSFCRYLGGMFTTDTGTRSILTFLDGEEFSSAYGIGENNCGFSVHRVPKGEIVQKNGELSTAASGDISDIVGRFTVCLGGKAYDTVRLVDLEVCGDDHMLCEYYLDQQGRTILWRRFNRDDWKQQHYGQNWSEKLPENERLILNGETYVHWYDCITDYIL